MTLEIKTVSTKPVDIETFLVTDENYLEVGEHLGAHHVNRKQFLGDRKDDPSVIEFFIDVGDPGRPAEVSVWAGDYIIVVPSRTILHPVRGFAKRGVSYLSASAEKINEFLDSPEDLV